MNPSACKLVQVVYLQKQYVEVTIHDHQHYNWGEKSKHVVSHVYVTKILTCFNILQYLQHIYHLNIPRLNLLHVIKIVFNVQHNHF